MLNKKSHTFLEPQFISKIICLDVVLDSFNG